VNTSIRTETRLECAREFKEATDKHKLLVFLFSGDNRLVRDKTNEREREIEHRARSKTRRAREREDEPHNRSPLSVY
jgi:hypothetical protein